MFLLLTSLFFYATFIELASSSHELYDAIVGQELIGSHFGIPFFNATFDYVIIGGGTAGLTLATRLAENATNTVAVIEAGGFYEFDNGNLSAIPAGAGYWVGAAPLERNPLIDWGIHTEPMVGLGGRNILYSQGKTLGGGSARNYLIYQRSTADAYQRWADTVDDQSYSFEELLPYFQKSVSFEPPNNDIRPANATPGYNLSSFSLLGEPLKVSFPNFANAFSSWVKLALKELGLKEIPGFTSGSLLGFQYSTQTLDRKSQTRSSSETAFLRKALRTTSNLSVYKSTLAKKILFDSAKTATGVLVDTGGVQYTLTAKKEVILSAGAFRSPQLLMVSGIGPKVTLDKFNISVVADRRGVGQNLWDHVLFGPAYEIDLLTHSKLNDPAFYATQVAEYRTNRTGMLTNTGSEFLGWEKIPASLRDKFSEATSKALAEFPADWPEIELIFLDAYAGYQVDFLTGSPPTNKTYASASTGLTAPLSRGNVTINSTDTSDNPVVNLNLLSDPRDQEVAVQAFKRAREIFATKAIQPIVIGEEVFPGTNITTHEEILDLIKQSAFTIYHASATNAMGKRSDLNAVVDSQAKVIGVHGLRVVDASAFPFLPPGHPQATVYALAEKIAALIQKSSEPETYGGSQG